MFLQNLKRHDTKKKKYVHIFKSSINFIVK